MHQLRGRRHILQYLVLVTLYICFLYNSLYSIFPLNRTFDRHFDAVNTSKTHQRCLTKMSRDRCKTCLKGWHGHDCGIPPHPDHVIVSERQTLRYIVQISIVNHEIDLLRLKIENSLPYTDEFVVIEGDKTFALESKPFYVHNYSKELSSLIKLRQHHIHIKTKNKYSWEIQDEMRLLNKSLKTLYADIHDSALVIFTDLDEIVRPEVLHFLKYYDSYPFPNGVEHDTYLFGFFYHDTHLVSPSIFGNVYQSLNAIRHQHETWLIPKGGWHCTWCYTIEGIQIKLKSSPYVDLPRIADDPIFMEPEVIYDHVLKGKYFIGNSPIPRSEAVDIPYNTPLYMTSYDWWLKHPPKHQRHYQLYSPDEALHKAKRTSNDDK